MLAAADTGWAGWLDQACRTKLVVPVFQPIVDLARGVVCGYEALSRFGGPAELGGPQEWFAAAAWHGYAGRLEALALRVILERRGELPVNSFLSVNLSPDALSAVEVGVVLADSPDLSGVVFEITEQSPVEDYEELGEILAGLRARGAMIAVDDTGSGYASLSHLLALRPQFVKVDRKLVTGIDHDSHRAAAVSAIGAFAGELDAWLIAEGVENQAELERLIQLEVPMVQGYFLGRPAQEMQGLSAGVTKHLRQRQTLRRSGNLAALAQPAPAVQVIPDLVAQITVLVDALGRPQQIFVPAGGRRASRYPAMCVQPHDELRGVALRATARDGEHGYAPLCLCDDLGRLTGVITIATLLETLAR